MVSFDLSDYSDYIAGVGLSAFNPPFFETGNSVIIDGKNYPLFYSPNDLIKHNRLILISGFYNTSDSLIPILSEVVTGFPPYDYSSFFNVFSFENRSLLFGNSSSSFLVDQHYVYPNYDLFSQNFGKFFIVGGEVLDGSPIFVGNDLESCFLFLCNYFKFNISNVAPIKICRPDSFAYENHLYLTQIFVYGFLCSARCCYPDFTPILRSLGGVPVTDQSQNLKMICQLLGVDTNMTLENCEAMKEYLKRIVQVFGGFPQNEPNDNLKIICDLLGVDSNSNGLSDCDLSKDYVKRISKMLGAE